MADSDVQAALFTAANTFLTAQSITGIAWPNVIFDPAGKATWARVTYNPTEPFSASLGALGIDREAGFMQIDINTATNVGDSALRTIRNAARSFFVTGKTLTSGTQKIQINACFVSGGLVVDNFYQVNITVRYRADLQRAAIT